ncbi:MAG: C-GCAxxG-C-C family protein [Clostridiales bacterium]|nr:C-GCAxxG-C-C family protein [Clostridiales bacterium]
MKSTEYSYYIEQDNNCAESMLRAANDRYNLGLEEESIKLISAFGGGMGCGKTCGALCGALAALGKMEVKGRAHATEGFSESCRAFVEKFEKELGDTDCAVLKGMYYTEELRCLETVERTANVLSDFIEERKKRDTDKDVL